MLLSFNLRRFFSQIREVYLCRQFLISSLDPFPRMLFEDVLLSPFSLQYPHPTLINTYFKRMYLFLLVLLIFIEVTVVVIGWAYLGRSLWLTTLIFIIAYASDMILIKPCVLFCQFLTIDLISYKYSSRLQDVIEKRAKYILNRTQVLSYNIVYTHSHNRDITYVYRVLYLVLTMHCTISTRLVSLPAIGLLCLLLSCY